MQCKGSTAWATILCFLLFAGARILIITEEVAIFLVGHHLLLGKVIFLDEITHLSCAVKRERIVHPFSRFPSIDKTGFAKNSHMVRKRRLTNSQGFQQLTRATLSIHQKQHNLQSVFICKCLEYFNCLHVIVQHFFHLVSK